MDSSRHGASGAETPQSYSSQLNSQETRSHRKGAKLGGKSARRQPGDSVSGKVPTSKAPGQSRAVKKPHQQGAGEHQSSGVVVRDDQGFDVTPRSLLANAPPAAPLANESASESQSSAFDSAFGKGGTANMSSIGSDGEIGGMKTPDLDEASASETEGADAEPKRKEAPAVEAEPAKPVVLTEEQLDAPVTFELRETETFWLLDMPGTCVAMDSPAAGAVQAQNAAYDELLAKRKTMADMYVERSAQTFNLDKKPKEVQTGTVRTTSIGTQVRPPQSRRGRPGPLPLPASRCRPPPRPPPRPPSPPTPHPRHFRPAAIPHAPPPLPPRHPHPPPPTNHPPPPTRTAPSRRRRSGRSSTRSAALTTPSRTRPTSPSRRSRPRSPSRT